jgi:hypothetical protein
MVARRPINHTMGLAAHVYVWYYGATAPIRSAKNQVCYRFVTYLILMAGVADELLIKRREHS